LLQASGFRFRRWFRDGASLARGVAPFAHSEGDDVPSSWPTSKRLGKSSG
jgi:hypothetical protein